MSTSHSTPQAAAPGVVPQPPADTQPGLPVPAPTVPTMGAPEAPANWAAAA